MLVVTNQHNNKKVTVRVNDRGPFVAARIIDVSRAAAEQLDMIVTGTAPVSVESVDRMVVSSPSAGRTPPVVGTSPVAGSPPVVDTQRVNAPRVQATVVQPPVIQTLSAAVNTSPPAFQNIQPAADVFSPPAAVTAQESYQVKLSPEINIAQNKIYRLQIGSYKVARNAVNAFERLKNAGLNPAYERYSDDNSEYFRVVLAGVRGTDVQLTAEKLGSAGFREALIREEN
jgi:rare lipoprotein A